MKQVFVILQWLSTAADHLAPIEDGQLHVGLVQFSNAGVIEFYLDEFDNLPDVRQAINDVTFDSGNVDNLLFYFFYLYALLM